MGVRSALSTRELQSRTHLPCALPPRPPLHPPPPPAQVYALSFYLDAPAAAEHLKSQALGTDEDVCAALVGGGFTRALQIHLVRSITGECGAVRCGVGGWWVARARG